MGKRKTKEEKEKEALNEKREALAKMEEQYPPDPIDQYITQRFVLEPRCQYGRCSKAWLVCKDRATGKYVTAGSGERRYKTFSDSWEAVRYLRGKFINKKEESK